MRAAICREFGGPDVIDVEDVPSEPVGLGQVRVRVGAAAVNFPDVLLVAGTYQVTVTPPFVPGSEFAGVVEEIGADVDGVSVGDHVVGTGMVGAFAEEAVVAAGSVRPIPDGISIRNAAAFGVAHRTAFHVLRSVARLTPGEELIVLGAGGGIGLAAVQIGVHLGANVTAVASTPEKLEAAASCGAHNLIDHRAADLRLSLRGILPDGADVVIDPVGGDLAEPALRSLRWGGRFVTVGYASGVIPRIPLNLVLLKGCTVLGFQFIDFATHEPESFARNEEELWSLLADGLVVPHIGASFDLAAIVDALRLVADGNAIGKVIVDILP
jgi:NADPH2:quinone reductase